MYRYLHSAGRWSLIMMNMYLSSSTNKLVSKNQRATKVIQEVVSLEVPKLNHAAMNKKQRDQMQFSLKKD